MCVRSLVTSGSVRGRYEHFTPKLFGEKRPAHAGKRPGVERLFGLYVTIYKLNTVPLLYRGCFYHHDNFSPMISYVLSFKFFINDICDIFVDACGMAECYLHLALLTSN